MREATLVGFVLAILMAFLAVSQVDALRTSLQAVTTGALSQAIGFWPLLLVLIIVVGVVTFAYTAVGRR